MFEDSVEGFILRWKPYAAQVQLFSHTEGSPLLECLVGHKVLQVFERTSPYGAVPGRAHLIIHPMTETVRRTEEEGKRLEVHGISRIAARGRVLLREDNMVVLDAGAPLVVGVLAGIGDEIALGDWLELESLAPVHGFVVPRIAKREGEPQQAARAGG